jgi:hypothetical protein
MANGRFPPIADTDAAIIASNKQKKRGVRAGIENARTPRLPLGAYQ